MTNADVKIKSGPSPSINMYFWRSKGEFPEAGFNSLTFLQLHHSIVLHGPSERKDSTNTTFQTLNADPSFQCTVLYLTHSILR
jgi:hypothetical protein